MLVIRDAGSLKRGDTLRVDLGSLDEENRVAYFDDGRRLGVVAYDLLGPAGEGTMMVTASTLNVRKCRSTGCSVVGQVSRGQIVPVRELSGRWYYYESGDVRGYLNVEHLVLPEAYRGRLFADIYASVRSYYQRELAGLRVAGDAVFSGYDVRREGEELKIEFSTPHADGPGAAAACRAMDGIAGYVHRIMARVSGEYFPAYSAGIYYDDDPQSDGGTDVMVAGMSGSGGGFCASDK
jgi:hypothetical protein